MREPRTMLVMTASRIPLLQNGIAIAGWKCPETLE